MAVQSDGSVGQGPRRGVAGRFATAAANRWAATQAREGYHRGVNPDALTMRSLTGDDWESVHAWGSRPEVCRYQAWGPNSVEQSRGFASAAEAAWRQAPQRRWVYLAERDGRAVGTGELRIRSRDHGQGEIQYLVHPQMWGQGVGTAIGRRLLAIGFENLGLHRIYATCDPRNAGSLAVLRKLGMTAEGLLRHTMMLRDGWRDSMMFSVLAHEWGAGRLRVLGDQAGHRLCRVRGGQAGTDQLVEEVAHDRRDRGMAR